MSGSVCNPNVDKKCPRTTTTKSKGIGPIPPTEEQWLGIFMGFDSDRDGRLSKEEVENAFTTLGLSPPNKKIFASLSHVGENGNRSVYVSFGSLKLEPLCDMVNMSNVESSKVNNQ
ncbi:hypothetical protein CRYUN_Cryun24cG0121300 [Craigia yunnanensis]